MGVSVRTIYIFGCTHIGKETRSIHLEKKQARTHTFNQPYLATSLKLLHKISGRILGKHIIGQKLRLSILFTPELTQETDTQHTSKQTPSKMDNDYSDEFFVGNLNKLKTRDEIYKDLITIQLSTENLYIRKFNMPKFTAKRNQDGELLCNPGYAFVKAKTREMAQEMIRRKRIVLEDGSDIEINRISKNKRMTANQNCKEKNVGKFEASPSKNRDNVKIMQKVNYGNFSQKESSSFKFAPPRYAAAAPPSAHTFNTSIPTIKEIMKTQEEEAAASLFGIGNWGTFQNMSNSGHSVFDCNHNVAVAATYDRKREEREPSPTNSGFGSIGSERNNARMFKTQSSSSSNGGEIFVC